MLMKVSVALTVATAKPMTPQAPAGVATRRIADTVGSARTQKSAPLGANMSGTEGPSKTLLVQVAVDSEWTFWLRVLLVQSASGFGWQKRTGEVGVDDAGQHEEPEAADRADHLHDHAEIVHEQRNLATTRTRHDSTSNVPVLLEDKKTIL